MRIGLVAIVCLLMNMNNLVAQNLVPNGSFEINTGLPTNMTQWNLVVGWDNVTGDVDCQTPDYFHALAASTSGQQLPNTSYGVIDAQDGDAAMGIGLYMTGSFDYREYISAALSSPLEVGSTYDVSFFAALGANPFHGGASNNLGVAFSVGALTQTCTAGLSSAINYAPQLEDTSVILSYGWVEPSYSFTATQPFDRITIGNFHSDANTNMYELDPIDYTPGTYYGFYAGYYFIDNVSVIKTSGKPTNVHDNFHQGDFKLLQNPVDRTILFKTVSTKPFTIRLSDLSGRVVRTVTTPAFSENIGVDTNDLPNGLYNAQVIDETLVTARFKVVVLH